ncbi:twin-arginine translocation signal domain-containing protein [Quatrionicoccus australiensis]|uniref:twin-arginine translocation signal domain-containing protein n=1 Tax=Quatrionicoccus australiensis TaxID=138118 RepID=UPI001CF8D248|nr:twin-arginine translocation signal domain-containing protein [Quatrionicoccus australiensis]
MSSRRDFLVTALASIGATAGLSSCSSETGEDSYGNVLTRQSNRFITRHIGFFGV